MKKYRILFVLLGAILLITGCNKSDEPSEIVGGYTLDMATEVVAKMPKNAASAFEKATSNYTGLSLNAVALLGSQVVSGTNYMYLCSSTTVTEKPVSAYKIVVVYVDNKGNADIKSVNDFNIDDYTDKDISVSDEQMEGAWSVNKELVTGNVNNVNAFNSALEGFTGTTYIPLVHLGSQIVSGTNHAFLALGKTSTKDSIYSINVITIYEDLEGKTELKTIAYVDLANFNN